LCLGLAAVAGCSASSAAPSLINETPNGGDGGPGSGSGGSGSVWNPDGSIGDGGILGSGQCGKNTTGVIRDFRFGSPPDFEDVGNGKLAGVGKGDGDDPGIVQDTIGPDRKPVYAGPANGTHTTTGPDNFHMWFNDTPGINERALYSIPFEEQDVSVPTSCSPSGTLKQYTYNNIAFFPIDNNNLGDPPWGYGNEGKDSNGNPHNFSFTIEFHAQFTFNGCEKFDFSGDDDVFVFLNGHRVVNLGGIHSAESPIPPVDFVTHPEIAAQAGLVPGNSYTFDFFYCERHTTASDFKLTTTLAFQDCSVQ
jgi:fibro-slime domain-containing protein